MSSAHANKKKVSRSYKNVQKKLFGVRRFAALLGDVNKNISAGNGMVNAMLRDGRTITVPNSKVPNRRMKVWLGYDETNPERLQVLGERYVYNKPLTADLRDHWEDMHAEFKQDMGFITRNQFLPLLAVPSSKGAFFVKIYGASVRWNGSYVVIPTTEIDISSHVPSDGMIFCLLQADSSGTISAVPGDLVDVPELSSISDVPSAGDNLPLWGVKLYVGQDRLHWDSMWNDFVYDFRFGRDGGGGGGGTWGSIAGTLSDQTDLQSALDAKEDSANKGVANGYAELDASGKVPSSQLPAYVDDVLEYANYVALPVTGSTGIIYVTLDDNKSYRWSGSVYVEISASIALGETSATAYRGDRGKTAYDHSQVVTGNPHGTTAGDVGGIATALATAASQFLLSSGVGVWVVKTVAEIQTVLGLGSAAYTSSSAYAPSAKGVTNGDSHDHNGGDGGTIAYSSLSGLPTIVNPPATTALNDVQVGSGSGSWIKKTLAEFKVILSLAALAYKSTVGTTDIDDAAVSNAKMANMVQASVKGRASGGGTGVPADLTADQVLTILAAGSVPLAAMKYAFQGRLTLTSGTPYLTSAVADGTTLYLTPLPIGNIISLYTSGAWKLYTLTEISLTLTSLPTASRPYDIFVYDNAGTLTLEAVVWTSATARATALATQDGIYVKSGAADRRYVGTIYVDGAKKSSVEFATSGSTTPTRCHVWNYYNRTEVSNKKTSLNAHTYNSTTYRKWNNTTEMDLEIVCGVAEDTIKIFYGGSQRNTASIDVAVNWSSGGGSFLDWANATASVISAFSGGSIQQVVGMQTFSVVQSGSATPANFDTCVCSLDHKY